jgi:ceramide glucosyltransferase
MFFRRDVVDQGGGIRALGAELAEDAASTKLVHAAGLRVHLADNPFEQPLGQRSFTEVWKRQLRWARLRRITFPAFFAPEIFVGAAFPLLAGGLAAYQAGVSVPGTLLALMVVWYGAELVLARAAGWHLSWRLPFACLLRDLILPVLWIDAWAGDSFVWRGNGMNVHVNESEESSEPVEAWP